MKTRQSIIDQIQNTLGEMEDTGLLDELVNNSEKVGEEAEPPAPINTSETEKEG